MTVLRSEIHLVLPGMLVDHSYCGVEGWSPVGSLLMSEDLSTVTCKRCKQLHKLDDSQTEDNVMPIVQEFDEDPNNKHEKILDPDPDDHRINESCMHIITIDGRDDLERIRIATSSAATKLIARVENLYDVVIPGTYLVSVSVYPMDLAMGKKFKKNDS